MSKKNNYVIYLRKSVKELDGRPGIAEQLKRINTFIFNNNQYSNMSCYKVYSDDGWSGGNWKRPEWNKMIRESRLNYFSHIFVWHRDRLARDQEQFLYLFRNLLESNVKVFSVENNKYINMTDADQRTLNSMMSILDENERIKTGQKVKRSYELKKLKAHNTNNKIEWGRPTYFKLIGEERILKDIANIIYSKPTARARFISGKLPTYEYERNGKIITKRLSISTTHNIINNKEYYNKILTYAKELTI